MSTVLSAADAIDRVPDWNSADVIISEFSGGLSNRIYLVTRDTKPFFLRLDSIEPGVFELDRKIELIVLQNAGDADLAPEIVFAEPSLGILLCRGLAGSALTRESLDNDSCLAEIAKTLRRVHELPLTGVAFERREAAELYMHGLQSHDELRAFAQRCVQVIFDVDDTVELRCCHNDTVAGNFVATPALKLVDWEYACDNDPLFDLASLIGYHDLTDRQARHMLRCYDGNEDRLECLQVQCRLFDAVQWLWLANRQASNYNAANARRLEDLQQRIV